MEISLADLAAGNANSTAGQANFLNAVREVETVIVTASRNQVRGGGNFWGSFYNETNGGQQEEVGGGETNPEVEAMNRPTPQRDTCSDRVDNEAVITSLQIQTFRRANRSQELGSILYLDPMRNSVESTPLAISVGRVIDGVPQTDFNAAINWLSANNIPLTNILGLLHNHPSGPSENSEIERYPVDEDPRSPKGDWKALEAVGRIVNGAGGNGALLVNYIVDSNFAVRKFHLADKANYMALSDNQRRAGALLGAPLSLVIPRCG